ncbi:MAG: ABC transporter permease [Albidovulum sp.]|nr:ABC transporter permease [Albidovulum sp.]MDE0533141.1 ABC transporter permease [Albidovulum sp.]
MNARQQRWWAGHRNELGLLLALLALVGVFSLTAPNFLTDRNLVNILRAASYVGIIAFPMTFVIIAGEIDISVGPAVAFFGIAFAKAVSAYSIGIPAAIALVIAGGATVGACAGWLKVRYAVPTFISTLALWGALRGGARWWSDALPVIIPSREFRTVLGGDLLGIPVVAWIMFATFFVFAYLARFSRYGRHIYALGANASAVEALGIGSGRLRILAMASTGAFAALVGVLTDARLGSGNSNAASGLEFDVIAAVIVGGTLLTGGHGKMTGTLLGVLVIACLSNGLVLIGVDPDVQAVVRGGVILLAVLVNAWLAKKFLARTKA